MDTDDAFPTDIPAFLRRPAESAPRAPLFGIGTARAAERPEPEDTGPGRRAVVVAAAAQPMPAREPGAGVEDFFAHSRAEIARRLDAAADRAPDDAPQTLEISLPAAVARALRERAEREGRDESAVVLVALRRMGVAETQERKDGARMPMPRRHRRRRRA